MKLIIGIVEISCKYTFCFLSLNLDSLCKPPWLHVLTPPQSFCAGVLSPCGLGDKSGTLLDEGC